MRASPGQKGSAFVTILVPIVDREAVNLFAVSALKDIELRTCPAVLREWVATKGNV